MTDEERQQFLDIEHLRLLRLGYIIGGVFNVAMALFPIVHITVGILILSGHFTPGHGNDPDRWVGWFFIIMGAAFSFMFATAAVLKLLTARALGERRSKTFCMIVAALTCLGIPWGTALGVFTLVVLSRPTVTPMFAQNR